MGSIEITALIGLACVVLGAIGGYMSRKRLEKQDAEKDGHVQGSILTELGYIKGGVDDIKRKQERQGEDQHSLALEVQHLKTAHHDLRSDHNNLAEKNSRDHKGFHDTEKELQKLCVIHKQNHGGNI